MRVLIHKFLLFFQGKESIVKKKDISNDGFARKDVEKPSHKIHDREEVKICT